MGKQKPSEWLRKEFILGYFGNTVSIAQKEYHHFVRSLLNKKYGSPLDEVVSSTLLGSPGFIAFIKERFLSGKEPDKNLPALRELSEKVFTQDIFNEVESVFGKEGALARNVKILLCQKFTGTTLKDIGTHFGIGESGVRYAGGLMTK